MRSSGTDFVAVGPRRSWTVFRYELAEPSLRVVDFGDTDSRSATDTTVQTLTGDWEGYSLRQSSVTPSGPPNVVSGGTAPTQRLARSLHSAHPALAGFLAPSARTPLITNLVLFHDRIPSNTVTLTGRAAITV